MLGRQALALGENFLSPNAPSADDPALGRLPSLAPDNRYHHLDRLDEPVAAVPISVPKP